jgi:hypothetical protein
VSHLNQVIRIHPHPLIKCPPRGVHALFLPNRFDLQLDFMEAVFGCSKEIDVDRMAACTVCFCKFTSVCVCACVRACMCVCVCAYPASCYGICECSTPCRDLHACLLQLLLWWLRLCCSPAASQTCEGSGIKSGTTPSVCVQCQGNGQLVQAVRTPLGMFQQVSTCPRCEGGGRIYVPCEKCGGDGRIRESKKISLKVGG